MAGTLIPVTLVTALNSDLPGEVVAYVTRNVYDTQQRHLLIPAGSKVLGKVDNQVGLGQARVNIVWHRIVFPTTTASNFRASAAWTDRSGRHPRPGEHPLRPHLSQRPSPLGDHRRCPAQPAAAGQRVCAALGRTGRGRRAGAADGEVSSEMIRRNMQVGPTLEVRPGFKFSIYVSKDLVLEPYDRYETH